MRRAALILCWLSFGLAYGQERVQVLLLPDYMDQVRMNHPAARQADLTRDEGEAKLLKAKGFWDPKLEGDISQKYFKGLEYYSYAGGGLVIPGPLGLKFQSGFDQTRGVFLNPEANLPEAGLWHAGVSLPLGRGLGMDERRRELRVARIGRDAATVARGLELNDLFLKAQMAYWDWVAAWHNREVANEGIQLTSVRQEGVRNQFRQGEKPAVDTLEARIQLQKRQLTQAKAEATYRKAVGYLSNFLWDEGGQPILLGDDMQPPAISYEIPTVDLNNDSLQSWLRTALSHPDIQLLNAKLAQLDVDRKWAREQVKPRLDVKYNALVQPTGGSSEQGLTWNPSNYTWGLQAEIPIFFRKGRGEVQINRIKTADTRLKQDKRANELRTALIAQYQVIQQIREQIDALSRTLNDSRDLLEAEKLRFELGESSLFLVNSRESSYLSARVDMIQLQAAYQQSRIQADWLQGKLQ